MWRYFAEHTWSHQEIMWEPIPFWAGSASATGSSQVDKDRTTHPTTLTMMPNWKVKVKNGLAEMTKVRDIANSHMVCCHVWVLLQPGAKIDHT